MDGKLFWAFALAFLVCVGLLFKGYDSMIAALGLVFLALITLKFSSDKGKGFAKDVRTELGGRLSALDGMVQDLTKAFKEQADIKDFTLNVLERTKTEMRTEMNEGLDRMAEKTIDIENTVNQMKRTFSAAFASLDDRISAVEPQSQLTADTGELTPEIKIEGADEGYVELTHEGNPAE